MRAPPAVLGIVPKEARVGTLARFHWVVDAQYMYVPKGVDPERLAEPLGGVVLANLVPTVPFVVLVMIPFIERIDPWIEQAARVFGASLPRLFVHVLLPLLLPGVLAALLLVLVRTVAVFELTFLVAGPDSQTLVVALYYAVFAAGVRAGQSIDAMAVVYMTTTLVWLVLALRFVTPTQIVGRAKRA